MPLRISAQILRSSPRISTPARRTLITTPRYLLNEVGNRTGEQLEQKKQEQLKKQEKGEGHWHEDLASQSEAKIAADKHDVKDHDKHMSELQKETAKKGEKGELKCDETPEVCQQYMTDRVTKARPRKKREVKLLPSARSTETPPAKDEVVVKTEPDAADKPSTLSALPLAMPPSRETSVDRLQLSESETQDAIARIQRQYRLPAYHHPSRAIPDALDMAFISHFVQQNNNPRKYIPEVPWITQLPNLHGTTSKLAVRLSIRAASMAFYAVVHRDTTILVDSYRWYTMSLNCQRQSLARLSAQSIPDVEEILVPIILSIYETYAGTTTTSIWPHLAAASKILELRGPTNCTGVSSTLFKIMRVSDAHRSIVFNEPSAFTTADWMEVPFAGDGKSANQELCDIFLLIPDTIAMLKAGPGSLRHFFSRRLPSKVDVEPVIARIMRWLQQLDEWALRFPYFTKAPTLNLIVTKHMANLAAGANVTTNGELALPDSFVAFTAASYEAVRLILLLLLHKVIPYTSRSPAHTPSPTSSTAPIPSAAALLEQATTVSKAILEIAEYQESTHPVGGFDVLRTLFPIVIVGILGPRQEEKDTAYETLLRWGEKRGITGLCTAWLNV
ncbi:hypothetical protein N0V90_004465 [Kalmusia sp. IMI 367209]|nr:hypothetical protein N0V90_004465 [Kalmusia sp. IMI 367209]